MQKMKTQMMIECKNNKIEISRLWLPEILLRLVYANTKLLHRPQLRREETFLKFH